MLHSLGLLLGKIAGDCKRMLPLPGRLRGVESVLGRLVLCDISKLCDVTTH